MYTRFLPGLALIFFLSPPCNAQTFSFAGQAKDLRGARVTNLNVEVLNVRGVPIVPESDFANGRFSVQFPTVPDDQRGVRVNFTAPQRVRVTVFLDARANHEFDVVLPLLTDMPDYQCVPAYYTCAPQCRRIGRFRR
jgi:hypothetical protein